MLGLAIEHDPIVPPHRRAGEDIPIEERANDEVACMFGRDLATGAAATIRIAPEASPVKNPAFDVTPAELITGIITERGVFGPSEVVRALDGT